MLRFFAFAGEADDAGRGVDEAADEEALRRGLAGRVLADLTVQLVGANHVTALAIHALSKCKKKYFFTLLYNVILKSVRSKVNHVTAPAIHAGN